MGNQKRLLLVSCSATKMDLPGHLPAIVRYDGPIFRVMRAFLRNYRWPEELSVAILSAEYGLIGAITPIVNYDRRMDSKRAAELSNSVCQTLLKWKSLHQRLDLVLGQDYQRTLNDTVMVENDCDVVVRPGPIGLQLAHVHNVMRECSTSPRSKPVLPHEGKPLYFLPDWDDFLDIKYDFKADKFSNPNRRLRQEAHSISLMRPKRLCDGVLVSLAQHMGSKGLLKRFEATSTESLAPRSVRKHFKLLPDQIAFGDCGAFSYVNEERPTITVEQAVALYDLYEFDFGCSVDHIPVPEINTSEGKRSLSIKERKARIQLTRDNAEIFIRIHKEIKANFTPVGVIQGITPEDYSTQIHDYVEMGYEFVALGGLVPRTDAEIATIIKDVFNRLKNMPRPPRIHLLGIFRPKLQPLFRQLGIHSFDSATYFRKSWLRSNQNYLGTNGKWYAAIRVPPSHDRRTMKRLMSSGHSQEEILKKESNALEVLRAYDSGKIDLDSCLKAIWDYDSLLNRAELISPRLFDAYRQTLLNRPWQYCDCPMCKELGIDIVIFRGLNRNKRRGAHNTLMLYQQLNNL